MIRPTFRVASIQWGIPTRVLVEVPQPRLNNYDIDYIKKAINIDYYLGFPFDIELVYEPQHVERFQDGDFK